MNENKLPKLAKAIGVISLVYGIWNTLLSPIAFFSSAPLFQSTLMRTTLAINFAFAIYILIASVLFLKRKTIGHKMVLFSLIFVFIGIWGWGIINIFKLKEDIIITLSSGLFGATVLSIPIIYSFCYLLKDDIKKGFY